MVNYHNTQKIYNHNYYLLHQNQMKEWYVDNKKSILEQRKKYRLENKQKISERRKELYRLKKLNSK
jgi:hypothetical protein